MSAIKTYTHRCTQCNEDTTHVPARSPYMRAAIRTGKILIFFISGGMIYPHPLPSDEDRIEVTCTKCLTHSTIN